VNKVIKLKIFLEALSDTSPDKRASMPAQ